MRVHLLYIGKARDLPRFSQVYADVVPAVSGRHALEDVQARTATPSSVPEGGRLPQFRPAADWVRT
jgi:hypothetical protein